MPSVPGMVGIMAASEALPQMEQQGIINGRVWGSQGKGKDSNLEIKCCCSVTSPEQPQFGAHSSWSPMGAPVLGAAGPGWGRCTLGSYSAR